jgi:hypothetical protein
MIRFLASITLFVASMLSSDAYHLLYLLGFVLPEFVALQSFQYFSPVVGSSSVML